MKTLRLMMSALTLLAVTACGASDVSNTGDDTFYEPEPTPEATPVPNARPYAPLFTLSADSVKPQDEVLVDLALLDPDAADVLTTECSVVLTSQAPAVDITGSLTKIAEAQYTFMAPVTATEIGTAVIHCKAFDGRGGESDIGESGAISIDNYVAVDPPSDRWRDICRTAKIGCKMTFTTDDLMNVSIPDPQIYIPDQVRGAYVDLPSTDYIASVTVDVDKNVAKYSILDTNLPSVQITVGTDALGFGYSLELIPYPSSGTTFSTMKLSWRWQVVALASNGMTKENLFAGQVLAAGNLGLVAPTQVDVVLQDGLVQFAINGSVYTPAIAATNVAGSQLGFSARAAQATFSNAFAIQKP